MIFVSINKQENFNTMEIKELTTYYIDEASRTLDVTFKDIVDGDDEIRTDQIPFDEIKTFGYNVLLEKIDEFEDLLDEDIDDYDSFDDIFEDELDDEVISFLNEYYMIYPDRLPKPEFF